MVIDSHNSLPYRKNTDFILQYSLSQLLIKLKINTTIIYFKKKVPKHIYILTNLKFLKEVVLVRQENQKCMIFVVVFSG